MTNRNGYLALSNNLDLVDACTSSRLEIVAHDDFSITAYHHEGTIFKLEKDEGRYILRAKLEHPELMKGIQKDIIQLPWDKIFIYGSKDGVLNIGWKGTESTVARTVDTIASILDKYASGKSLVPS